MAKKRFEGCITSIVHSVQQKKLRIDGGGISQVQIHGQGTLHLQREREKKKQQNVFHSSQENATVLTKPNSILSLDEPVVIKQKHYGLLNMSIQIMSFASANGDGDMFRQMFPDSRIAENYKQNETKIVHFSRKLSIKILIKKLSFLI